MTDLLTNRGAIRVFFLILSIACLMSLTSSAQLSPSPLQIDQVKVVLTVVPSDQLGVPPRIIAKVLCPDIPAEECDKANSPEANDYPAGLPEGFSGFDIYRVPAPKAGEPLPTAEQIVGDRNNLVAATGGVSASEHRVGDESPRSVGTSLVKG